ncbi:MAG: uracil permease [Spirochaetales bacterium]|nr:uracil permease [Spirochaetales bacterium]
MSHVRYDVNQKPPVKNWIFLSLQHVFAMFGATILVPIVTELSVSAALFTSGIGTLLYIVITRGKVPAYLGSSFAFIAPLQMISTSYGVEYAMGSAFCVGIFYCIVGIIIRFTGTKWIEKVMPPVVIGSVIMVIGLKLAPTAMSMAMNGSGAEYKLEYMAIAFFTLGVAITCAIVLKGFFNVIPILIAIVAGYLFTLILGLIFPNSAFNIINFTDIKSASWFAVTMPKMPKFAIIPILSFIIVSFATIAEHLGDTMVIGKIIGRDIYKNPGLNRTLAGDGVATAFASLFGGPPNTTYGENIGVMSITHVYSVWVIGGAAVIAAILSFFSKFAALITTIPTPVIGGVSMMLFGIIASAGIRTVVEAGEDYTDKKNLIISSVILVTGIGGASLKIPLGITSEKLGSLSFELAGIAFATLLGIFLNLILPSTLNKDLEEEKLVKEELSQSKQNKDSK